MTRRYLSTCCRCTLKNKNKTDPFDRNGDNGFEWLGLSSFALFCFFLIIITIITVIVVKPYYILPSTGKYRHPSERVLVKCSYAFSVVVTQYEKWKITTFPRGTTTTGDKRRETAGSCKLKTVLMLSAPFGKEEKNDYWRCPLRFTPYVCTVVSSGFFSRFRFELRQFNTFRSSLK